MSGRRVRDMSDPVPVPEAPVVRVTVRAVDRRGKVIPGGYSWQMSLVGVPPVRVQAVVAAALRDTYGEG